MSSIVFPIIIITSIDKLINLNSEDAKERGHNQSFYWAKICFDPCFSGKTKIAVETPLILQEFQLFINSTKYLNENVRG